MAQDATGTVSANWGIPKYNTAGDAPSGKGLNAIVDFLDGIIIPDLIVDAKGDLIAATGADAVARVAAGANDTVLVADSGQAAGIKWAKVTDDMIDFSSLPSAKVRHNAAQTITTSTLTAVNFNIEDWDTHGFHDTSSNNHRFTIPTGMGGKYLIIAHVLWSSGAGSVRQLSLLHNGGTVLQYDNQGNASGNAVSNAIHVFANLNAGDFLHLNVFHDIGSNGTVEGNVAHTPVFEIVRIG